MAVLHIVKFRPKADVDPANFAATHERFQRDVAPILPDLERREADVDAAGNWTLVLRYPDMASATKPPADHGNEIAGQFMQMIDMSTMSVSFQAIVSE